MDLDTTRPFRGSDAVAAGRLTKGTLRGRELRRLGADTYVAADAVVSPLLRVRAALVRGGPGAVATGWSACTALGLDVASRPEPVEIATARRLRGVPGLVARRAVVPEEEVTEVDGARTTTALRTAFDLARRSGPSAATGPAVAEPVIGPLIDAVAAADALARLAGFDADDLRTMVARHPGERGVARVGRVAALLDPRPDSPPESRARVRLLLGGLPRPDVRLVVPRPDSDRWWELDLAWRRYRVAIEYDGRDHALADRRGRDLDRLDALRREGWIVVVMTALQLARREWIVERAREALLSRGWTPRPNPWACVLAEDAEQARRLAR